MITVILGWCHGVTVQPQCHSTNPKAGTIIVNFDRATLQGAVTKAWVQTVTPAVTWLYRVRCPHIYCIFFILIIYCCLDVNVRIYIYTYIYMLSFLSWLFFILGIVFMKRDCMGLLLPGRFREKRAPPPSTAHPSSHWATCCHGFMIWSKVVKGRRCQQKNCQPFWNFICFNQGPKTKHRNIVDACIDYVRICIYYI